MSIVIVLFKAYFYTNIFTRES